MADQGRWLGEADVDKAIAILDAAFAAAG